MNEAEIDSWYEEEKERLMDRYLLALEKGKNRDKEREKYSRAFRRLHQQYEKNMNENIIAQRWHAKMRAPESSWRDVIAFFR